MKNIYDYKLSDLETYMLEIGEKKFKARQLFEWLYKKRCVSFDDMTNLSKSLIEKLKIDFTITTIEMIKKQTSKDAKKYLFKLDDNNLIEAVLMMHDYGTSLCVSSQIGCNMGCVFCESGRLKRVRNLRTGEMVEQILEVEKEADLRIDSVVVMGIGEPFDNYDNLMDFIRIINDNKGIEIGARHITVSTSGLVPKIKEFTLENIQVNLAISLHAPNDELRNKLMPINKAYKIGELMKAIDYYIKMTNRRVTIEYLMLKDTNDTIEYANELSELLKGKNVYVNLIPYNETSNIEYKRSDKDTILKFYDILKKNHINVTIRREFGGNIDAACGQLRASEVEK